MGIIDVFRQLRRSTSLLLTVVVGVSGAACTAGEPPYRTWDTLYTPDAFIVPDSPPGCPAKSPLQAPVIDPYPNPTVYATQPVRGTAPGAAQVLAQSGVGAAAPVTVSASGKFCIEVQLIPDAPNKVMVTPLDDNGCVGPSSEIAITHKSSTSNQDAGVPTIFNTAKGQPITTSHSPDKGVSSYVNDGDPKSFAKYSFWDWDMGGTCDRHVWVRIDLGKTYTVSKLTAKWPPQVSGNYATCWAMLLSSKASPVDPDPKAFSDWKTVKETSIGGSQNQVIAISPEPARWAAFLMYENATTSMTETFELAEFEVWGQDPNAVPPPPPDRCQ